LWNIARPFGHPLIVHCSVSGTAVVQFASSIIFIKSIDEFDGLDVIRSTSIASFQELIFVCEDVGGVVMASAKKPLRFSDFSEMELYSDLLVGKSCDHHVIDVTMACEASRASS
jgi:hypothetical protein